jgi:hypothetical protein
LFRDCETTHAGKRGGVWMQGAADIYQAVVQGNGTLQIRVRCGDCRQNCGFLPHHVWRLWVSRGAVLTLPVEAHEPTVSEPCSYSGCTNFPTEYHHFAPSNTFGNDADNWPCAYLCRQHHHQWHRVMTGYSWHARRTA